MGTVHEVLRCSALLPWVHCSPPPKRIAPQLWARGAVNNTVRHGRLPRTPAQPLPVDARPLRPPTRRSRTTAPQQRTTPRATTQPRTTTRDHTITQTRAPNPPAPTVAPDPHDLTVPPHISMAASQFTQQSDPADIPQPPDAISQSTAAHSPQPLVPHLAAAPPEPRTPSAAMTTMCASLPSSHPSHQLPGTHSPPQPPK